jgi:glucose/arabinose dehydrogenase/mono/diheme cytochrome c family protein
MIRFLLSILAASIVQAAPVPLFDGKSLDGWEGNKQVWRVADGVISGGSLAGNPKNEFLVAEKTCRNFILRLEYKLVGTEGFVNGGVQFHSQRIDDPPNEMIGYQADIGAKFTGFLYDESRRKTVLAAADEQAVASIEKPGDWNTYEIRAENGRARLSVNGTQTIDYTEKDPKIPLTGKIGLQIHGGCKAVISFRNITIETLPDDIVPDQGQILGRFGNAEMAAGKPAPLSDGKPVLLDRETIIFTGQTNLVREQKSGLLEGIIARNQAEKKPVFRSMAWEADTVYEQWRDLNFGSWENQLRAVGATTVIAQFGQMEALDGAGKVAAFTAAYHRLLDQFAAVTPRIILISPTPFEKPDTPHAPDLSARNQDLKIYNDAIREIAKQRGAVFIDLFSELSGKQPGLTGNGVHLNDHGLEKIALLIGAHFGTVTQPSPQLIETIREKNRLWFDCWRPANWSFVYGDRIQWPFAKPSGDIVSLRATFEAHKPLVADADARIHTLASGGILPSVPTSPAPSPPIDQPITPEAQMEGFTLAEGYQVNLFADESLGVVKPTQFCWDENGRLFVACSPTYPHPLPGVAPSDYILILEDTDHDGKADKSTRFAEGLTMVQGVEIGGGGVYVCDFDQIIHLKDTDGDGKADQRKILLSGFGIGDTHQLVNSIAHGPDGCLWFSQGLHAVSRIETPYGIKRLDKAGIWKFNPRTLELTPYFNNGTAGHNCWGVAFDDDFQPFHKSGDRPHGYYSLPGLIEFPAPDDYHSVANLFESSPKTTALDFIGTKALPADIQGCALIGGYFGSVVELHRLADEGSGFVSKQLPRLLVSKDTSFRPVDVSIGPDGGIYLADWFNPVIGHYQASYADPKRDRSHGRIWRISHQSLPSVKQPVLREMSAKDLIGQLSSPERWTRAQARRLLSEKPSDEVLAAISASLTSSQGRDLLELCAVARSHEQRPNSVVPQLLSSADPKLIAYGIRAMEADENAIQILTRHSQSDHPRVRLESIVAAARIEDARAVTVPLNALKKPRDRFIDYALKLAVGKLQPLWQPALTAGSLRISDPEQAAYLEQFSNGRTASRHPGEVIYESLCLNCHQPGGAGLPGVYPPLTPNEWIGDPDSKISIKILLHGLNGPITVGGKEYGVTTLIPMPPMGLDDRQVADVLTYIRSSFGNQASPVTVEQVRSVRQETASRTAFWTARELKK